MHRFRKRSDPKRGQVPHALREPPPVDTLPPLPPASDFRTSLILPDLTRRFSVLRNSSGEPIGFDELKSRFEAQRARGSQNRVSESEEDMILEALSRLRTGNGRQRAGTGGSAEDVGNNLVSAYIDDMDEYSRDSIAPSLSGGQSLQSATTSSGLHGSSSIASLSSGKGSQLSRRMSNNLFGSGKFHDATYIRTVHHGPGRRGAASHSSSMKHSESTASMSTITSSRAGNNISMYSDSLRPVTPEESGYTNSVPSSPNNTESSRDEDQLPDLGAGLAKALAPELLPKASLALDEVIREIEEEGDDEIVLERSPIATVADNYPTMSPTAAPSTSSTSTHSPIDEAGMALSSDDQIVNDEVQRTSPYPRSRTTSPIPRLPGYIPGMPRPMTPHESSFDLDDQTPSATPRATSPRLPGVSSHAPPPPLAQSFSSNMYRSNSNASTSRASRPTSPAGASAASPSPLFFNRTPGGRFTPEDRTRSDSCPPTPEPVDSPVLGRRRPLSPLSGPAYQPMVSAVTSPRPGTPSNITWTASASTNGHRAKGHTGSTSTLGHSRNGSVASITDNSTELDQSRSSVRSSRSPGLSESTWVDIGLASTTSLSLNLEARPPSAMSGLEPGFPMQVGDRSLRSPTPTHGVTQSPSTYTFPDSSMQSGSSTINGSRRSSKQNGHTSFSLPSSHALLLSPIDNSSRSSFESTGSSYHSWDEDHRKDRLPDLFNHLDPEHTEWHDFSRGHSGSSTSQTTPPADHESDEIVRKKMGLNRSDVAAIQDRLVSVALTKAATPEGRHRASSLRRRRPSTSQSNYSFNGTDSRVATPAQSQPTAATTPTPSSPTSSPLTNAAVHAALLDAVVDSIQSRGETSGKPPSTADTMKTVTPPSPTEVKTSSPGTRQRALADALFGVEDRGLSPSPIPVSAMEDGLARFAQSDITVTPVDALRVPEEKQDAVAIESAPAVVVHATEPLHLRSAAPLHDPTSLALDVQRRAEAATAALRKSPSIPKVVDVGSTRRRISPGQISSPKLLSASTSVDTIPLPPVHPQPPHLAANGSSTKLGSRFKKLRGTLRAKTHVNEEVTSYSLKTPPSSQTITYATSPPAGVQSATEPYHLKSSALAVPVPPASATPGLRGFMSLFRKQRHGPQPDVPPADRRGTPTPPAVVPASMQSNHERRIPSPVNNQIAQSEPPDQSHFVSLRPLSPQSPLSAAFTSTETIPEDTEIETTNGTVAQNGAAALKQLFDAAQDLGLDQAALNDLVARSPSLSSKAATIRTRGTRSNSVADGRQSKQQDYRESTFTQSQSPIPSEGRTSVDAASLGPSAETRQLTIRKNLDSTRASTPALSPQPVPADPMKAIVRRTIIVPSDSKASLAMELNALMRKQSLTRRRRSAGAASNHSNRSLQDRAPTPPPPKASGGRRFSTDRSPPPVPQIPTVVSPSANTSTASQLEQSSSAYDSLYDMYADNRVMSSASPDGGANQQHAAEEEAGPAVEVIELANGETIWSIVNGLRDDDAESFYDNRRSFASEYSGEGVKVLVKEHGRKGSKSSNVSFLSRKKQLQVPPTRPETKVFFSSSAQIGRLIESLSRDMDAGSFNITPDHTRGNPGHSASPSVGSTADVHWTLEERLEHMLGSMSAHT